MAKSALKSRQNPILFCPVCFSDRLDPISERMKKCESCGFIWNHEVSDRDNLMLIVEHQKRVDETRDEDMSLKVLEGKRRTRVKSAAKSRR